MVHPKEQGQRSEAAVLFEFTKRGLTVLTPFGDNERYDLVVEEQARFYRIQVKTGRLENGRVQFETRSSGTLTRKIAKEGYTGQVDFFAVYSPDTEEVYVVPISEAPKTTMGLRIEDAKKRSPNINWAADYTVCNWLNSIQE
ncbi:group I intron-associated PD-(D/E)XK endonuclease [Haloarchaeobius sp. DFWS5]|uniref:group I intron-associated PD-(D/E)XK endonuclease n=1 Tax=Haloarchaeobius sp. DFWS5 TaxID=3446114 RepID=UPI003EB95316